MELENKEEEAADDDEMVNKDTLIVLFQVLNKL